MKGKVITIVIVLLLIILGVCLFMFLKPKKGIEIKDIKSFSFSYSTGYYYEASIKYTIDCDDICFAVIKKQGEEYEKAKKYDIDEKFVKKVEDILNMYNVSSWNGFDKTDKRVMDGDSFNLYIKTKENKSINASGYMKWPDNYDKVKGELDSVFSTLESNA